MMKVPVFEEIHLNQTCSSSYIEEKFSELKVGEIPILIQTDKISREDLIETLPNIEIALKRLGIHPRLPYPIVILTKHIKEHQTFLIINSLEELPKHFNLSNKRLSKKELQILNKLSIAKDKFCNLFTGELLNQIPSVIKNQRKLYTLSKELHFYEQLKKRPLESQENENESKKR